MAPYLDPSAALPTRPPDAPVSPATDRRATLHVRSSGFCGLFATRLSRQPRHASAAGSRRRNSCCAARRWAAVEPPRCRQDERLVASQPRTRLRQHAGGGAESATASGVLAHQGGGQVVDSQPSALRRSRIRVQCLRPLSRPGRQQPALHTVPARCAGRPCPLSRCLVDGPAAGLESGGPAGPSCLIR